MQSSLCLRFKHQHRQRKGDISNHLKRESKGAVSLLRRQSLPCHSKPPPIHEFGVGKRAPCFGHLTGKALNNKYNQGTVFTGLLFESPRTSFCSLSTDVLVGSKKRWAQNNWVIWAMCFFGFPKKQSRVPRPTSPALAETCPFHRWPFGKINGPGKWKKPHLNQCHLCLIKLT